MVRFPVHFNSNVLKSTQYTRGNKEDSGDKCEKGNIVLLYGRHLLVTLFSNNSPVR